MFSFSACAMCLGAQIEMHVKYYIYIYIYIYIIYISYIYIYIYILYIPLPTYSNYNPVDEISTKTAGRFSRLFFSISSYPQSPPAKPLPKATHLTPRKNNSEKNSPGYSHPWHTNKHSLKCTFEILNRS